MKASYMLSIEISAVICKRESAGLHTATVPEWGYCLPYTCRVRSAFVYCLQ